MSTIKHNVKTITRNSIAVPVETVATTVQVASDLSDMVHTTIREAIPTTKRIGNIAGMFLAGMCNADVDEQEAGKRYKETTFESVMTSLERASLKAGQDLMKAFDDID